MLSDYLRIARRSEEHLPIHKFFSNFRIRFNNTLLPIRNLMSYKPHWLTKARLAKGDLTSHLLIWWTVLWHLNKRQSLLFFSSKNSSKCTLKDSATAFGSLSILCSSTPLASFNSDQKVRGQCQYSLLSLIERNSETAVQKGISVKVWLIFFFNELFSIKLKRIAEN